MKIKTALIIVALTTLTSPALARDTTWGALALDTAEVEKAPAYGVGGADTEAEASSIAMDFCVEAEGVSCKVAVTYEHCGALAVSGKGEAGWGKSESKEGAEEQAMQACAADACEVVVSDCN